MSTLEIEEWVAPREIVMNQFNSLRGRLCTVIESMGLPAKQERALITLIKQASYQQQHTLADLVDSLSDGDVFRYVGSHLERGVTLMPSPEIDGGYEETT